MTAKVGRPARRRGQGEGSVYQRTSDGRWVGTVHLGWEDGKRKRRTVYGRTQGDVVAELQRIRANIAAGLPVPAARLTVGQYLHEWSEQVLPGTVSQPTEDTYRLNIRLYIAPAIGRVRLGKLTPAHVTDMLRTMEARGFAPETQRLARSVLRRALRRAQQEGIIGVNVAAIADGVRVPRAEGRTLTAEQARTLLARARDNRLEAAYVLSLALGLRRGEVLGLAWSDLALDAEAPTLSVRRQLRRGRKDQGLVLAEVKTAGSRRTLHLPRPVVDVLRAHRRRQAGERLARGEAWRDDEGLVFTTPLGTPVEPRNYGRWFSQLAEDAGLGHWSTHELRHSCASLLLAMGVPLEVVSETLGHSSIRVTKDRYGHLLAPARAAAAEAMGRALWA